MPPSATTSLTPSRSKSSVATSPATRFLNNNTFDTAQVVPSANYGLGLRLIPFKNVAIRAELVNYTRINPNVEEHDDLQEASCTDGYVQFTGQTPSCLTDFSQSAMFQVGVSFLL